MMSHEQFNSVEWLKARDEKLRSWCCSNIHAVDFCLELNSIIETWDDLIDGDKDIAEQQLHHTFCCALLYLPANPFYQENMGSLLPTLTLAINAWMDANEFERNADVHERMWAFFLRNLGIDIIIQVALICGGMKHMRSVSAEIRRFFTHETYDTWEHRHVQSA